MELGEQPEERGWNEHPERPGESSQGYRGGGLTQRAAGCSAEPAPRLSRVGQLKHVKKKKKKKKKNVKKKKKHLKGLEENSTGVDTG